MVLNGLKYFYVILVLCLVGAGVSLFNLIEPEEEYKLEEMGGKPNSPYSLQMYTSIEKYSKMYKVPKHVAYNVAYRETRYQGPFDWNYHGKIISTAGAQGPMQIITRWAHKYAGRKVTDKELRNNIDLNVMISMKMLRARFNTTGSWGLACGGYNTGSPVMNEYAKYCISNIDYKKNWVKY